MKINIDKGKNKEITITTVLDDGKDKFLAVCLVIVFLAGIYNIIVGN